AFCVKSQEKKTRTPAKKTRFRHKAGAKNTAVQSDVKKTSFSQVKDRLVLMRNDRSSVRDVGGNGDGLEEFEIGRFLGAHLAVHLFEIRQHGGAEFVQSEFVRSMPRLL